MPEDIFQGIFQADVTRISQRVHIVPYVEESQGVSQFDDAKRVCIVLIILYGPGAPGFVPLPKVDNPIQPVGGHLSHIGGRRSCNHLVQRSFCEKRRIEQGVRNAMRVFAPTPLIAIAESIDIAAVLKLLPPLATRR